MKYLITLKPLEPYFFGSNLTFGKLGDKDNGSYIAKSNYFPQQSTFLGLFRKIIIEEVKDYEKAIKLVGGSKFFIKSRDDEKLNFGAIKEISNLFIKKDKEFYIPLRDIFSFKIEKDEEYLIKEYKTKGKNRKLEPYKSKNEKNIKLFNFILDKSFDLKEAFKEVEMVGNSKKEKDNAFFKKIAIDMCECFSFAYIVEFNNRYEFELEKLDNKIVNFGGDRSKFLLNIKKDFELEDFTYALKKKLDEITDKEYIYLLSDSYININIKKHCDFAITKEKPFRYLSKSKKNRYLKSKQFYFYEGGGFFLDYDKKLEESLNKSYLQQIGYNKFITRKD